MTCLDDLDVLDYIEERMAAERIADVRAHLDTCTDCLGLVAQLTGVAARAPIDGVTLGRTISSGGMGLVVEAFDTKLERRIALKLPRTHDAVAQRRFEREVKITARLQHPAIVPVYAAGTLGDGEPYYAMRLVDGDSLDVAIERSTNLTSRLALVRAVTTVASAIAYAHSQGILHRDIKPANVLVGPFGEVVVIDWGLARAQGDADTEPALAAGSPVPVRDDGATVDGAVVGTPAYMAPEQARGEPIDERADVYALGALLYHVLRGAPPGREGHRDLAAAVPELPRDLVAIVAEAMAPDPANRYRTAAELSADLERFQTGQLVGAHDYSLGQLVRRWIGQHRAALTVAAIALVVVTALATVSVVRIVGAERVAERERESAVAHRADAEELMSFMLVDLRDKLMPIGKLELLDSVATKAKTYYAQRTSSDPVDQQNLASALHNVGDVLLQRGDLAGALVEYRRALVIQQAILAAGAGDDGLIRGLGVSLDRIGEVRMKQGDEVGALASYRAGLELTTILAARDPSSLGLQHDLSVSHTWIGSALLEHGDLPGAIAEMRTSLALDEKVAAADPSNSRWQRGVSVAQARIGDVLLQQGQGAAALVEYRKSLAINERLAASDPANTEWQRDVSLGQQEIGDVLRGQGDADAALALFRSAQAVSARLVARDPSNAVWQRDVESARNRLGEVLQAKGDLRGALAEYTAARAIALQLAATDPTNSTWQRDLTVGHEKVGTILSAQGDHAGAIAEYRASLVASDRLVAADPDDPGLQRDLVVSHLTLGGIYVAAKDMANALAEHRIALAIAEKLAGRTPPPASASSDLAEVHRTFASLLVDLGDRTAALAEYRAALALIEALAAADPANQELRGARDELARTASTCCR